MPSPPAATCLLFYPPDNNIIAIGMDDSTILIYNIRVDEVLHPTPTSTSATRNVHFLIFFGFAADKQARGAFQTNQRIGFLDQSKRARFLWGRYSG